MNLQFDLVYLSGGDRSFGERYGDATIDTITRAGYATECPNVGRLLRNLKFSLRGESEIMMAMRNRREQPEVRRGGMAPGKSVDGRRLVRGCARHRRSAGLHDARGRTCPARNGPASKAGSSPTRFRWAMRSPSLSIS